MSPAYRRRDRLTTSDSGSPRRSASTFAATHVSSGTRSDRMGVLGALGIAFLPLIRCIDPTLPGVGTPRQGRGSHRAAPQEAFAWCETCTGTVPVTLPGRLPKGCVAIAEHLDTGEHRWLAWGYW